MMKLLFVILNYHIDWEAKQVEKCTGMLKYTKFPKICVLAYLIFCLTRLPHTWSLPRMSSNHILHMIASNTSNKMYIIFVTSVTCRSSINSQYSCDVSVSVDLLQDVKDITSEPEPQRCQQTLQTVRNKYD